MEIMKIRKQGEKIKLITIPKKSNLKAGDYVVVKKINLQNLFGQQTPDAVKEEAENKN